MSEAKDYILHPPIPNMTDDKSATYKFLLELWTRSGGYFNNDTESAIPQGSSGQYYSGDKTWQNLTTGSVLEASNLYFTEVRSRDSISTTALGLNYDSTSGVLGLDPLYLIPSLSDANEWNSAYNNAVTIWSSPLLFSGHVASIQKSDATHNGYLDYIDWGIFNAKVDPSRTISTTAPLQGGGDLSADRTLSITQSGVSSDGYLSSTDWNIFYAKEPAITSGTIAQYWRGDKTWQTLNATAVGLGNVTNDAQTKAAIVPNTLPASGQILVGNAGGTAYAPQTMSTDVTLTSTGVATIANNAVTNAKLSQAGANTYKGNNTGITANVSDISTNTAFNQSFETLTTNIKPIGTVNVGALNTLPRADHIHPFSVSPPLLYNALTGALSLGTRSFPLDIETNGIYGNYRSRNIGAAGNFNFNFKIPQDFNALIDLYIEGFVSAGAAGINKNIDISVEYCNGSAQLSNQFTASDTTTVYNLTGLTGRLFRISVASLLTNLTPGTVGGIKIRHTTLGGGIDYVKGLVIYV